MKTYVMPLVLLWMLTPVILLGQGIKFVHRDEGPTHTKLGQPINRPSKQGVDRLNAVLKFTMGNVDFRYKLLSRTDVQTELTCSERSNARQ